MTSKTAILLAGLGSLAQAQQLPFLPGDYWLESQNLENWEWDVDHDLDGVSTRREYFAGTNPFDHSSTVTPSIRQTDSGLSVSWNSLPGACFQLLASPDLVIWEPLGAPVIAGSVPGEILVSSQLQPPPTPSQR